MFTTVKNLTALIDKNIGYLTDGVASGKADADYVESMEYMLDKQLKRLQEISCNKSIIDKYTAKIFNAVDYANKEVE